MIKNRAFLLAALLLTACDDKDDSGEHDHSHDSGTTDTSDTTDDGTTPAEGDWYASDETVVQDECGLAEDDGGDTGGDEDTPVTLTLTSESSFTLNDGEGLDLTCTFDSADGTFACDAQSEVSDFTKKGFDAILTITQTVSGSFSSSTTGDLTANIDATCEGKDCGFISSAAGIPLPCSTVLSVSINHGG